MKKLYYQITNKKLLQALENIEVSQSAINQYQTYVKGNNKESLKTLVRKLKRNFIVGSKSKYVVEYGNLCIHYKEYHDGVIEITSIYNKKGKPWNMNVDKKLKKKIDKLIELELFD